MAKILQILCFTLFIILTYSCKKEEPEHIRISDEFKRWTVFNKGSYWIFQNDSTFELDSLYLKENPSSLDAPAYNSKDNFTLEWIEMSYSSKFLSATTQNVNQGGMENYNLRVYNNSAILLIANSSDNFLTYSKDEQNEGYVYQLLFHDTVYYIGPEKFNNVVCTQFVASGKKVTGWFSKDIGLIKMTGENTNPDFSWSCLRFHIVK